MSEVSTLLHILTSIRTETTSKYDESVWEKSSTTPQYCKPTNTCSNKYLLHLIFPLFADGTEAQKFICLNMSVGL